MKRAAIPVAIIGDCKGALHLFQRSLDAEDPEHANWTRFINHEARAPNLAAIVDFECSKPHEAPLPRGAVAWGVGLLATLGVEAETRTSRRPRVRFVVERPIQPGEELSFNYGTAFHLSV